MPNLGKTPGTKGKAPSFQDMVVVEAERQGVEVKSMSAEEQEKNLAEVQADLPGIKKEDAPTVSTVRDGKMLAQFVRPIFFQDNSEDDSEKMCALEISFPITKEHKGLLPKQVDDAYVYLSKHHNRGVIGLAIEDHLIEFRMAPDDEVKFEMNAAIVKAEVRLVRGLGKGSVEKIPRFSFRAAVNVKQINSFVTNRFGEPVWITMEPQQRRLDM